MYLYIPAASAYPKVMINGIIYTLVKQLNNQNLEQNNYIHVVALLFTWLCARGWKQEKINLMILQAITKVQQLKLLPNVREHNNNHNQYFLNLQYHPSNFPQAQHQNIFKEICSLSIRYHIGKGQKLKINKIIIDTPNKK